MIYYFHHNIILLIIMFFHHISTLKLKYSIIVVYHKQFIHIYSFNMDYDGIFIQESFHILPISLQQSIPMNQNVLVYNPKLPK